EFGNLRKHPYRSRPPIRLAGGLSGHLAFPCGAIGREKFAAALCLVRTVRWPGRKTQMRIAMIGVGYVGLVSGACFADFGHRVSCIDKDMDKIAALERGEIPIFEPGLNQLVATNTAAGRLDFAIDLKQAVSEADAVFIAVGTPSRSADGHSDL